MLDAHCHLDRYPDALAVAREAELEGIITIGVTNLPSHFALGHAYLRNFRRVRLALGLHPLLAASHTKELAGFRKFVDETSYVGEVGLDHSREGQASRAEQEKSFRQVLAILSGRRKFLTLHSRGAESQVLELLAEHGLEQAVFHWYSGPLAVLDRIVAAGHFFSVNPAMVSSPRGRAVVGRIPPDRLLTETDGPHVRVGSRPAKPSDVRLVIEHLSRAWAAPVAEVESTIDLNFKRIVERIR